MKAEVGAVGRVESSRCSHTSAGRDEDDTRREGHKVQLRNEKVLTTMPMKFSSSSLWSRHCRVSWSCSSRSSVLRRMLIASYVVEVRPRSI